LRASRQAEILLQNLEKHREALRKSGWRFGRARLAMRAARTAGDRGCIYCGLCMYGCPYGYIYNSADTVRELRTEKNFQYQRDVVVTALHERSGKVIIEGYHRQTRAPLSFESGRAYLAAGVIPTAQILLRSRSAYDRPLHLRDSQYFLFPLVLARRARGVRNEPLYTLSQLFIELGNPQISRHTVHLQIYTYNDLIGRVVHKAFGPLAHSLAALAQQLEERMIVVQGYLHSDESPMIEMTLKRDGLSGRDCLHLVVQPNPATPRTVKRVLREMLRQTRWLGGMVLPPMLQMGEPGRGFHAGGSMPMRREPAPFESDCLGRPHGWTRVHAVDATVLPSMPATTITFSVMANAHRIGWETAMLD
jgi:ferredoxin